MVAESDFLGATRKYGYQLVEAVGTVDLDTPVSTCPDWKVRDLAAHTAAVYQHKMTTVSEGCVDESPPWPSSVAKATGDDVVDVLEQSLDALLVVLEQADLTQPIYTWCPHDHTVDWWVRRMAHESLIHAADGMLAAGGSPSAEPWLATDGVDEILDEMMVGAPDWAELVPTDRRIDLKANDRVWSLRTATVSGESPTTGHTFEDEPGLVLDSSGSVAATVSTDPATLNYWLWGRTTLPPGSVEGDTDLAAHVRVIAADATG